MPAVVLTWAANPTLDSVDYYEVFRGTGSGVAFGSCTKKATVAATTWTDASVTYSTTYTYYVVAHNSVGESAPDGPVNITVGGPSTTYVQNLAGAPSLQEGTHSGRPAAATAGPLYVETDTKTLFRDNGASWDQIGGGSGTVTSVATGTGLTGGTITTTGTIALAAIANHDLLANTSGGSAAPIATTLTALIDDAIGSTQGDILYRGASGWVVLAPGTSGDVLQTGGASANPSWTTPSAGSGTVTSVGISSTDLSVSGSPVTGSGSITLNVNSASITNAKLATMTAHSIKGNATAGTAAPTDMSGTTTTALLDAVVGDSGSGGTKGLVPAPASGDAAAGKFLKADGTWTAVSGASGGTVTSVATGTGLTGGTITGTGTISLAAIADHDLLANTSGGSAAPIATTLTALIDNALGSTRGSVLYRGASGWTILAPGTSGQFLETLGAGADPAWASNPFDLSCYYGSGVLTSLNIGVRFTANRAISFAANFGSIAGGSSHGTASAAATGSTVFNVDKAPAGTENTWTTIGTVTYAGAAVVATFATTGGSTQSLAAGDSLRIIAPSTPDATLAGVSITLAGSR